MQKLLHYSYTLALISVMTACGGNTITNPGPVPTPSGPVVQDGLHPGMIVPATIIPAGGELTVTAPGYLTRRTFRDGGIITLWPGSDTDSYLKLFLYTDPWWTYNTKAASQGLQRILATSVSLVPSDQLAADGRFMDLLIHDAAAMTTLSNRKITWKVNDPGAAVTVTVMEDPNDPYIIKGYGGLTYKEYSGLTITGARVVISHQHVMNYDGAILHELGHVFGFGHSPDTDDLMYYHYMGALEFTQNERNTAAMMLQRQPGNQFPDTDFGLTATRVMTGSKPAIACQ